MKRELLRLGNEALYQVSEEVVLQELDELPAVVQDLHDTMMEFQRIYGAGRAIAAPQIGVFKRILYMNTGEPVTFINPRLQFPDAETMAVLAVPREDR